jgi:tRNA (mo5U34)-methyltransferase
MADNVPMKLSEDEIRSRIAAVPFWFHQIEVAPGIITPGLVATAEYLKQLKLPADLTGKRVLDIGAWDGFYSFECERRGAAEVIAIDGAPSLSFDVAHELLGSRVKFYTLNIYDLKPELLGQFDLVLCLGVLYHLRHPLLGLEKARSVCKGSLILETAVCDHYFIDANRMPHELGHLAPLMLTVPIARFYPDAEYNNDMTNWWAPNLVGLHAMLASVGFTPQETLMFGDRACVHCERSDPPPTYEWADSLKISDSRPINRASQLPIVPSDAKEPETVANHQVVGGNAGDHSLALVQSASNSNTEPTTHVSASPADQSSHSERFLSQTLAQALSVQGQQNLQLQRELSRYGAQIADLEERSRWLEQQSRDARRALEAVENGRVMRLLRWLSRTK